LLLRIRIVGLNGGFVHTVQLGANYLTGIECQAWYTGAHEGAAAMETRCILIAVSGFAAY